MWRNDMHTSQYLGDSRRKPKQNAKKSSCALATTRWMILELLYLGTKLLWTKFWLLVCSLKPSMDMLIAKPADVQKHSGQSWYPSIPSSVWDMLFIYKIWANHPGNTIPRKLRWILHNYLRFQQMSFMYTVFAAVIQEQVQPSHKGFPG